MASVDVVGDCLERAKLRFVDLVETQCGTHIYSESDNEEDSDDENENYFVSTSFRASSLCTLSRRKFGLRILKVLSTFGDQLLEFCEMQLDPSKPKSEYFSTKIMELNQEVQKHKDRVFQYKCRISDEASKQKKLETHIEFMKGQLARREEILKVQRKAFHRELTILREQLYAKTGVVLSPLANYENVQLFDWEADPLAHEPPPPTHLSLGTEESDSMQVASRAIEAMKKKFEDEKSKLEFARKEEIRQYEFKINDLEAKLRAQEQDMADAAERHKMALEDQKRKGELALEAQRADYEKQMSDMAERHQAQVQELENVANELRLTVTMLQDEMKRKEEVWEAEKAEYEGQISSLNAEITELKDKCELLESRIAELEKSCDELMQAAEQAEQAKREVETLKIENSNLKLELENLKNQILEKESKCKMLEESLKEKENEILRLQQEGGGGGATQQPHDPQSSSMIGKLREALDKEDQLKEEIAETNWKIFDTHIRNKDELRAIEESYREGNNVRRMNVFERLQERHRISVAKLQAKKDFYLKQRQENLLGLLNAARIVAYVQENDLTVRAANHNVSSPQRRPSVPPLPIKGMVDVSHDGFWASYDNWRNEVSKSAAASEERRQMLSGRVLSARERERNSLAAYTPRTVEIQFNESPTSSPPRSGGRPPSGRSSSGAGGGTHSPPRNRSQHPNMLNAQPNLKEGGGNMGKDGKKRPWSTTGVRQPVGDLSARRNSFDRVEAWSPDIGTSSQMDNGVQDLAAAAAAGTGLQTDNTSPTGKSRNGSPGRKKKPSLSARKRKEIEQYREISGSAIGGTLSAGDDKAEVSGGIGSGAEHKKLIRPQTADPIMRRAPSAGASFRKRGLLMPPSGSSKTATDAAASAGGWGLTPRPPSNSAFHITINMPQASVVALPDEISSPVNTETSNGSPPTVSIKRPSSSQSMTESDMLSSTSTPTASALTASSNRRAVGGARVALATGSAVFAAPPPRAGVSRPQSAAPRRASANDPRLKGASPSPDLVIPTEPPSQAARRTFEIPIPEAASSTVWESGSQSARSGTPTAPIVVPKVPLTARR